MTDKKFSVKFSVVMNSTNKEFMEHFGTAYSTYKVECAKGKATIETPLLVGLEGFKELKAVYEYLISKGCSLNNECTFEVFHECTELHTVIKALQMYRKLENVLDKMVCEVNNDARLSQVKAEDLEALQDVEDAGDQLHALLENVKCIEVIGDGIVFKNNYGSIDYKKNINWAILSQRFIERATEAKFVTSNQVEAEDVRALRNVLRTIPAKGCDAYTSAAYNYLRQTA